MIGNGVVFRGARVATMGDDGDLPVADVLVRDGLIEGVGSGLDGGGAEEVPAAGMLLIPGLADTHVHLWEALFRGRASESWGREFFPTMRPFNSVLAPPDVYMATYLGALELLAHGTTSMIDFCPCAHTAEHAAAAYQAMQDAGVRGVFGFDLSGSYSDGPSSYSTASDRYADIEAMADRASGTVQVGVCLSSISPDSRAQTTEQVEFARSLDLPATFHYSTGGEITLLDEWGLLGPDLLPAHGNWATDEDLDRLAAAGGFLSVTPEVESLSGNRPMTMIARAHRRGVRVALGVDVPAMVSASIFAQMRYTFLLQRLLDGMHQRAEGQVPLARRPGVPSLRTRDVLEFGSINGVDALGLGSATGRIEAGKAADLVLIDTRTFGMAEGDASVHAVLNTGSADIHSVMVAGEFRVRDRELLGVDLTELGARRDEARSRVAAAAGGAPVARTYWGWVAQDRRR